MIKPFELEYYLAHPKTKVVTRDGRDVRILCTDLRSNNYTIVAACDCKSNGMEIIVALTNEGKTCVSSVQENPTDLFFNLPDPVKKRVPLTYEDLLERVKDGKTLFVDYTTEDMTAQIVTFSADKVTTTEDMTAQIVTFSADKVTVAIRGKIYELSYRWMFTYYFADGTPCWKEVDE